MRTLLIILTLSFGLSSALDKVLQIVKTSRVKINEIDHFEIEVTGSVGNAQFDHFHLNILTDDGASQYQGNSVAESTTKDKATFKGNLADVVEAPATLKFILTQRSNDGEDTPVSQGDVEFTLPVFPDEDLAGAWVGDDSDIVSLRIAIKDKLNGFQVEDIACKGASPSCYYVGVTKKNPDPTEFCKEDTISVCDKTHKITDEAFTEATVDEAELKYPKNGKGEILVTPTEHREVVVYMKEGTVTQGSIKVCYTGSCDIDAYTPSTVTHQVLVVDTSADPPTMSKILEITDYELHGTGLSTDLIETRWTRTTGEDSYKVSREHISPADDGDEGSFTETMVTCKDEDNSENFHCFAYFVGLETETAYELTVEKGAGGELNKVTLKGTETDAAGGGGGKSMKISRVDTKWHKGLRSLEVNICFHNDDASQSSSYEAIFVNKLGQWRKLKGVTHKLGSELCFDALHMDIHSFDLSDSLKLVVVERGHDGISVRGSAETVISVEGNQSFTDI